jgi:hypothetical protein
MKWDTLIGMKIANEKFDIGTKPTFGTGRFAIGSGTTARCLRIKLIIGNTRLCNEYFQNEKSGLLLKILNKNSGKGTYRIPQLKIYIFVQSEREWMGNLEAVKKQHFC